MLVEGVPASGKSTLAAKIYKEQIGNGFFSTYYKEETRQPVDLFRQAVMTPNEYMAVVDRIGAFANNEIERLKLIEALDSNSWRLGEHIITAYSALPDRNLVKLLHSYDIGDGNVDFASYKKHHMTLWNNFVDNVVSDDQLYITEGAFLHNQILDLIGFYDATDAEIINYFASLADIIRSIDTRIFYIQVGDFGELVKKTLESRGGLNTGWGAGFERWLAFSNFGKSNQLCGVDGIVAVYEKMDKLMRAILDTIEIPVSYITRDI